MLVGVGATDLCEILLFPIDFFVQGCYNITGYVNCYHVKKGERCALALLPYDCF